MTNNLPTKRPIRTVLTTGKGEGKAIVAGKPVVTSSTGKVVGGGNQVDIVFVFDTTGSMDDKIEALLLTCRDFVDEAKKLGLDLNFSLISFGDISVPFGGDRIELVVSLTEDVGRMKEGLERIPRNNGFGNTGESCLEAIQEAFKIDYRAKAVKVMVLITDEPALQHQISVEKVIGQLGEREFLVFVIAIDTSYYREMATKNGGFWKEIGLQTSLVEILRMFEEMAKKVSQVAKAVHLLGKGSVKEYLKLKPPSK